MGPRGERQHSSHGARISRSLIGTSVNIARGGIERGLPKIPNGSHRLKLTNRWARKGGAAVRLTERSGSRGEQTGAER
jgi:hypothetical protein